MRGTVQAVDSAIFLIQIDFSLRIGDLVSEVQSTVFFLVFSASVWSRVHKMA
jgi:hypothetical protein